MHIRQSMPSKHKKEKKVPWVSQIARKIMKSHSLKYTNSNIHLKSNTWIQEMLYINVNKENMLEWNHVAFKEDKNAPTVKLKGL